MGLLAFLLALAVLAYFGCSNDDEDDDSSDDDTDDDDQQTDDDVDNDDDSEKDTFYTYRKSKSGSKSGDTILGNPGTPY